MLHKIKDFSEMESKLSSATAEATAKGIHFLAESNEIINKLQFGSYLTSYPLLIFLFAL